jgi:asparagine synthase (glutamine-hydrolysing)
MCGLVGHVALTVPVDFEAVRQGCLVLAHRGPDGEGQVDLEHCSLAHRRLSIIDLEGSPQPWRSDCGRYYLVFNGEIYNYRELRRELEGRSWRFRSEGDTEVLMNLYVEYGEKCLDKLNGMFAFAVWDTRERLLFMARDRLGEKPLYYAEEEGQIAFASELAALDRFGFIDRSVDGRAVDDYFAHQFIGGERSIWSGIRKLMPAHWLRWQDGRMQIRRYWKPPFRETRQVDEAVLCEELRFLIEDSVRLRLRADVPVGMFLSGGLDSSLVALGVRDQGHDVQAFTIGFHDASYDESHTARGVAKALEISQQLKMVDMDDAELTNRVLDAFGEPYADPSALPTWQLCRFARNHVTVALSGDGVDELFGGYRRYYARSLLQRLPFPVRYLRNGLLDRLIALLPESSAYYGKSLSKKLRLLYGMISRIAESPGDSLAQTFSLEERRRLLGGGAADPEPFDMDADLDIAYLEPVSRMMAADQLTYLPEDILVKVDRMSMRHGLEVRNPFLDHRLAEFAARLPLTSKIHGSLQKRLLRNCYRGRLPENVLQRSKHGFSVPLGRWFRQGFRQPFEELVLDGNVAADILERKEILHIWQQHQRGRKDNGFRLWSIYAFCRWYRGHAS